MQTFVSSIEIGLKGLPPIDVKFLVFISISLCQRIVCAPLKSMMENGSALPILSRS